MTDGPDETGGFDRDAGDRRRVGEGRVEERRVGEGRVGARRVGEHRVHGVGVDDATRCVHYDTDRDVVAIRFACCDRYYPCHACHDAVTDHDPERVPREAFEAPAVLCGACGVELSVATYLDADHACPACDHEFNPGCATHADLYFDV
jgi:uncharacterized CHY-type Zn-finger protein